MIFNLFPELLSNFSQPVVNLVERWMDRFWRELPQQTRDELTRRLLSGHEPPVVLMASPVLAKFAQVLARDERLPETVRSHLQALESSRALGNYLDLLRDLERETEPELTWGLPLAEGSLAVVFSVSCGSRRGVAKVLKPGIEQRLPGELVALQKSVRPLASEARRAGLPQFDYEEAVKKVRRALEAELDLRAEAENLALAQKLYPKLLVPAPWRMSNHRVLFMDRIQGEPLQRHQSKALVRELLLRPLFSSEDTSLLHGDLHGGNIVQAQDGRISVLDWGLSVRLSHRQRSLLSRLTTALLFRNKRLLRQVAEELGLLLGEVSFHGSIAANLDQILDGAGGTPPDWMMVARKTFHQLEGVVRSLDPATSVEAILLEEGVQRLLLEWPFRFWVRPHRREPFGTHLSTLDLWGLFRG